MTSSSLAAVWCQLLALLGLEVGLIVLAVVLLQRWTRWAAWRRTFCRAGVTAVLVIAACELSGSARVLAGWAGAAVSRSQRGSTVTAVERRKPEGRNPKAEGNPKSEGRRPARYDSATLRREETPKSEVPESGTLAVPASSSPLSITSAAEPVARGSDTLSDPLAVLGICLVWALGAALVSGRAGLGQCLFILFRLRSRPIDDPTLLRRLGGLAQALGISRRVRVIESARLAGPIAFGVIQPTVGLPASFGARFDTAKQDAMLAHELAHLAAHDPFWCFLADVATVVLWWHPGVWWLRRQLHLASEMAADEASLLVADGPRVLAECLVELGARLVRPRLVQLRASGFRSHLGRRVQRLVSLEGAWGSSPHRGWAAFVGVFGPIALVVAVVLCTAWAAPQALTRGDSMKTMQLNWKRSLATFALLASVNGPDATPAVAQSGKAAAARVAALAPKEESQGAGAAALLSNSRGQGSAQRQTQPPTQATPQKPPASSPSAKAMLRSVTRPPPYAPPYQEQQRDGATHVLGAITNEVTWTAAKSPYVMDATVRVENEGTLKIEPGVVIKVIRAAKAPDSVDDYTGLVVMGTLVAEGTPEAMIRFTPAAANPQRAREWQGIFLSPGAATTMLKWTIVEGAANGVDALGSALIAHNIFRDCGFGIFLQETDFVGDVVHNVCVSNASRGIMFSLTRSEASATDNIFYGNNLGLEALGDASPYMDYNLCFAPPPASQQWCYMRTEHGPHDVQADPLFVKPEGGDFRLASNSPARRAGHDHSDLGLDSENWSPENARRENERWLADGGRQLWIDGLRLEATRNPQAAQSKFESALKKPLEPELKDKVCCALGRVLTAQGKPEEAEPILRKVIKESQKPHLRDMARRHLAEALVVRHQSFVASVVLNGAEWPQSKVWLDAAKARCQLQDPRQALAVLEPIRQREPDRYLRALSELVDQALADNRLQTAMGLCDGFEAYPDAPAGSRARLKAARALEAQGDTGNAAKLLKKIVETDPFGREAPEALSLLAKIPGRSSGRPDEATQILTRLCTDYYLFDPVVSEAREEIGFEPLSPRNMILLDASQWKSSIYDRSIHGSCGFGQFEVIEILSRRGFKVHTNERDQRLVTDQMKYYGLVIMNGRYGGVAEPPMMPESIEACEAYVKQGGNLLVIASGEHLGSGKTHLFYNPLLQRFGMKFREGAGIPWKPSACVVTRHPALQGLDGFMAYGGVTIDPGKGEVLGTYNGEPIIVAMPYGKGRAVAAGLGVGLLGTCMSSASPRAQEDARKNEALLNRLAAYLLANAPSRAPRPIPTVAKPRPPIEPRTAAGTMQRAAQSEKPAAEPAQHPTKPQAQPPAGNE
jgi:beta-lactamase regulating signal transducer with metallopeptidase domain/tetratricopeptide (TPR) repeat protein